MRLLHIVVAAAASLTATIGMAAETRQQFVHEGRTYVYQAVAKDGGQVITGRELRSGAPFRLVVKNGRVKGKAGNSSVSFRVRDAQGASGGIAAISN